MAASIADVTSLILDAVFAQGFAVFFLKGADATAASGDDM